MRSYINKVTGKMIKVLSIKNDVAVTLDGNGKYGQLDVFSLDAYYERVKV